MGYGYYYDPTYILVVIGFIITLIAEIGVKGSYSKYKKINASKKMTGQEVARKILDANGLENVQVKEVGGTLSDHYNPSDKTVNLSTDIYKDSSIASIAVAAHECGHAIQDKEGYLFLRFRSLIFPVVNVATSISYYIILIGFIFEMLDLVYIGIGLTTIGLFFQIITLPVEFNASKRAGKEIDAMHLANSEEKSSIKKVLVSAALTYVAGVLTSALQILRLLLIANSDRD